MHLPTSRTSTLEKLESSAAESPKTPTRKTCPGLTTRALTPSSRLKTSRRSRLDLPTACLDLAQDDARAVAEAGSEGRTALEDDDAVLKCGPAVLEDGATVGGTSTTAADVDESARCEAVSIRLWRSLRTSQSSFVSTKDRNES